VNILANRLEHVDTSHILLEENFKKEQLIR
jgi:hypothetical protein